MLEGSARVVDTRIVTFSDVFTIPQLRYSNNRFGLDLGRSITDRSGGTYDGFVGFVQLNGDGSESNLIWIDENRDGRIDNADKVRGPSNNQYEKLIFTEVGGTAVVGGRYIRWANMLWCR